LFLSGSDDIVAALLFMPEPKKIKDFIEMRGTVEELLPAAKFKILLENGQTIFGHLSGKMRMYRIRLLPGDQVKVELSPYDLTKGRIVYRF